MKVDSIKPQKVSSVFPIADMMDYSRTFETHVHREFDKHACLPSGMKETSGLTVTLCLDACMPVLYKIGRTSMPRNMLVVGEFLVEPGARFARSRRLCRCCEVGCDAHY